MTYRGRIKNGVVILDGKPSLEDGTLVAVKPLQHPVKPQPGSLRAVLQHAGMWESVGNEVDEQLKLIREMKKDELRRQLEDER